MVFGESYFGHVIAKGTRRTVKSPVVCQAFVTNMTVVVGDGIWKQVGSVLPWMPAGVAGRTFVTGVASRTKLTFVSGEPGFTKIARGRVFERFRFMHGVTPGAVRARPSVVAGADTSAINA